MADNTVKIWTINELMKRYGINRASMTEYVKAKINIINKDDIHAKKAGKEWQFDAEAVRILDELRGYGVVVENYDTPEKAKIAELEEELEEAFHTASREAASAFGNGDVFLEKYLTHVRHVEMQILADHYGNILCLQIVTAPFPI